MFIKRNARFAFFVILFFFIVMVSAAMLPEAAPAADKPIALKFAYWMSTKHSLHPVFEKYANEVKALTNGRVDITLYPGGALGGPRAAVGYGSRRYCRHFLFYARLHCRPLSIDLCI